jgi:hypothetical protein
MTLLSSFVFEPVAFFRHQKARPPSWGAASLPVLIVMTLHVAAYSQIARKTISAATSVLGFEMNSFYESAPYVIPALSSCWYLLLWLMATGFMASLDILRTDNAEYGTLLKSTGMAFYSQAPYLAVAVVLAALFEVPDSATRFLLQPGYARALEYRSAIQGTLEVGLVRDFGIMSQLWLVGLFAAAYRAHSGASGRATAAIALALAGMFIVMPSLIQVWL